MAITTLAGVRSGLQPPVYFLKTATSNAANSAQAIRTLWAGAGFPAAGSYDSTLNGVALTAPVTGALSFTDPNAGNAYLARFQGTSAENNINTNYMVLLCDRLWHNGGYDVTSTSAQLSTTPAWPARDVAGSTNGDGVLLALEVSAASGAATPIATVSYTNSAGLAGQSATQVPATLASSSGTSRTYTMGLQAGDTGVRSVQSLTLNTSWLSGTMNLVAYRPIAICLVNAAGGSSAVDAITAAMPRLFNDSVLYFMMITAGGNDGSPNFSGKLINTWG